MKLHHQTACRTGESAFNLLLNKQYFGWLVTVLIIIVVDVEITSYWFFNSTVFTIASLQVVQYYSLPALALSQAQSTAGGSSGMPAEIRPGGTVAWRAATIPAHSLTHFALGSVARSLRSRVHLAVPSAAAPWIGTCRRLYQRFGIDFGSQKILSSRYKQDFERCSTNLRGIEICGVVVLFLVKLVCLLLKNKERVFRNFFWNNSIALCMRCPSW